MSFVSFSEIRNVFLVRTFVSVRMRTSGATTSSRFGSAYHFVRLGKVEAGGADFLPKKGNGIKAQNPATLGKVQHDDVEELEKKVGTSPIQVHLIGTEGRPNIRSPPRV